MLEGARQVEEAERALERVASEANKAASKAVAVQAGKAEAVVAGEKERQGWGRREQCVSIRERTCEDKTVRPNIYPCTLVRMGHEARLRIWKINSAEFEIGAEFLGCCILKNSS